MIRRLKLGARVRDQILNVLARFGDYFVHFRARRIALFDRRARGWAE